MTADGGSNNDSEVGTPSEEEISLEDVNVQDENALHRAAAEGHIEVVQHLIKGGANINAQDKNRRASLHYAVMHNHQELVKFLIKYEANVNAQDRTEHISLYYAAMNDNKKSAKYL